MRARSASLLLRKLTPASNDCDLSASAPAPTRSPSPTAIVVDLPLRQSSPACGGSQVGSRTKDHRTLEPMTRIMHPLNKVPRLTRPHSRCLRATVFAAWWISKQELLAEMAFLSDQISIRTCTQRTRLLAARQALSRTRLTSSCMPAVLVHPRSDSQGAHPLSRLRTASLRVFNGRAHVGPAPRARPSRLFAHTCGTRYQNTSSSPACALFSFFWRIATVHHGAGRVDRGHKQVANEFHGAGRERGCRRARVRLRVDVTRKVSQGGTWSACRTHSKTTTQGCQKS